MWHQAVIEHSCSTCSKCTVITLAKCDMWRVTFYLLAFEWQWQCHLQLLIQAIHTCIHLVASPLQGNLPSLLQLVKWPSITFLKTARNTRNSVMTLALYWSLCATTMSSSNFWILIPDWFLKLFPMYPWEERDLFVMISDLAIFKFSFFRLRYDVASEVSPTWLTPVYLWFVQVAVTWQHLSLADWTTSLLIDDSLLVRCCDSVLGVYTCTFLLFYLGI